MVDRDRELRERPPGDDEGFLRRWSRRKAEARREAPEPEPEAAAADVPAARDEEAEPPVRVEDLPDIDSLDASSDFKAFMRPGVPEHLRKLALRKMWRVDPSFSKLDGLVEYGEDYTFANRPGGVIKTAYQVGRGFVNRLEELAPAGDRTEDAVAAGREAQPSVEKASDAVTCPEGGEPAGTAQPEEPGLPAPVAGSRAGEPEPQPTTARPLRNDPPSGRPRRLPRRG